MFHTEKRIVSSLETILETNRYWWRDGEIVTLHPQTPYSSKRQRKGEYDITKEIEEKCTKIDVLSDEIESNLKQCLELKDKRQCPSCFAEIEKDVKFCPKCGAKQEEIQEEPAKEVEVIEKAEEQKENKVENKEIVEEKEQAQEIKENKQKEIEAKEKIQEIIDGVIEEAENNKTESDKTETNQEEQNNVAEQTNEEEQKENKEKVKSEN